MNWRTHWLLAVMYLIGFTALIINVYVVVDSTVK